jgi:hypothetical protein
MHTYITKCPTEINSRLKISTWESQRYLIPDKAIIYERCSINKGLKIIQIE